MQTLKDKSNELLWSDPEGASLQTMRLWHSMKPLDHELFELFFTKVSGPDEPRLDLANAQFGKGTTMQGNPWTGTVTANTHNWHGIVRMVKPNEWISEKSYKNGKYHGLSRDVHRNEVRVILNKDGKGVASLIFDSDLNLIRKTGIEFLLAEIDSNFLRGDKMGS